MFDSIPFFRYRIARVIICNIFSTVIVLFSYIFIIFVLNEHSLEGHILTQMENKVNIMIKRLGFSQLWAFVQVGVSVLLSMTLSSCFSCSSDNSIRLIESTNEVQYGGENCLQTLQLNLGAFSDLGYFSLQTLPENSDNDYGGVQLMGVMFDRVTSFVNDEIVISAHNDETIFTDQQREK